jgi:hypothetical protein
VAGRVGMTLGSWKASRGKRVPGPGGDPHPALCGSPRKVSGAKRFWKTKELVRYFKQHFLKRHFRVRVTTPARQSCLCRSASDWSCCTSSFRQRVALPLLVNGANPILAETTTRDVQAASRTLGLQLHVLRASTERGCSDLFDRLVGQARSIRLPPFKYRPVDCLVNTLAQFRIGRRYGILADFPVVAVSPGQGLIRAALSRIQVAKSLERGPIAKSRSAQPRRSGGDHETHHAGRCCRSDELRQKRPC